MTGYGLPQPAVPSWIRGVNEPGAEKPQVWPFNIILGANRRRYPEQDRSDAICCARRRNAARLLDFVFPLWGDAERRLEVGDDLWERMAVEGRVGCET